MTEKSWPKLKHGKVRVKSYLSKFWFKRLNHISHNGRPRSQIRHPLYASTFLSFPSFEIIFLLFPFWIHIITNSNNHFFFKLFNVFFFRIQRNQGLQPTFMVLKKSNFDPGLGSKFFDEFFDIGQNSSHKFLLLWYNVLLSVPIVIQSPLRHKYDPNNYFCRFDSDSHVIYCSILIWDLMHIIYDFNDFKC